MNFIIFMACSSEACERLAERTPELLTFGVVGVILILMGLLANIVYVKCSQRSGYNSICWKDIKPTADNTFLGGLFGFLGLALVLATLLIGLIFGVYKFIITL